MREDLSTIVSAIPLPTVIIGVDERIVNANDPALELFGKNIEGRHLITAFRNPQLLDAIESCQRNQTASNTRFVMSSHGVDVTFQASVRLLEIEDFSGLMICCEDVSHILEAGQIRRDFVANVSHELRTPLTAMLGFIETIRGPARNDANAQDRFLGMLESETKRMTRLVQDLLSLSRVESEERVKPSDETDLVFVLHTTIERLRPVATERSVEIVLNCPLERLILRGSQDQLSQIFTNLIENGVKYGGLTTTVTVDVEKIDYEPSLRSRAVNVSISDKGPGIEAKHIPRLTERFYRIDTHRSREMGGTGLGLAIVKHIVNRHRGRLRITSKVGEGSRFTVTLPIL